MLEEIGLPILSQTQAGLLFLSLGLVVGSFCSVIWHRLPAGRSILWPRSCCPHCSYQLWAADLVPVLSFLWLGGRCRKCHTPFGWHYLGWELGVGGAAMIAGVIGGWAGGVLTLVSWILGVSYLALLKRNRRRRETQAGFTLVEVLVAFALLVLVMAPLLHTFSVARNSAVAGEKRTLQAALARARLSQIADEAFNLSGAQPIAPTCTAAHGMQTGDTVLDDPSLSVYEVHTSVIAGSESCEVSMTVSCPTCKSSFGLPLRSYTVKSVIRKKTNGNG